MVEPKNAGLTPSQTAGLTPSQTVGPFFHYALLEEGQNELVGADRPEAVRIEGTVYDGAGDPVPDAMLEVWQANAGGRYAHPADDRREVRLEEGFTGFGRCSTDATGRYTFLTVKPGRVPAGTASGRATSGAPGNGSGEESQEALQAPHLLVSVFARGLLRQLVTRLYFPDEPEANAADPILSLVEAGRLRETLVAEAVSGGVAGGVLRFDIHLQGERQTAFLDV